MTASTGRGQPRGGLASTLVQALTSRHYAKCSYLCFGPCFHACRSRQPSHVSASPPTCATAPLRYEVQRDSCRAAQVGLWSALRERLLPALDLWLGVYEHCKVRTLGWGGGLGVYEQCMSTSSCAH
jgi:hypothetical protein